MVYQSDSVTIIMSQFGYVTITVSQCDSATTIMSQLGSVIIMVSQSSGNIILSV